MLLALIPLLVFITVVFLAVALLWSGPAIAAERLQPYGYDAGYGRRNVLDRPFSERIVRPIMGQIARLFGRISPDQIHGKIVTELEQAGNPMRPDTFLVLRIVSTVGLPALYGMPLLLRQQGLSLLQWVTLILLLLLGARLPVTWLRFKIDARQKTIQRSLPDALDLITVCMEAGLAFDASLAKVVQKTTGPLSDEFGRVLQEMNLGKSRRDALRDLGTRAGVPDLRSFIAAVVQADQMGIAIGDVLRTQSDELRVRRRQRAEEAAHKAPVKMLFPLIFCIFPSMMIVLVGPAMWAIYTNIISRMQLGT